LVGGYAAFAAFAALAADYEFVAKLPARQWYLDNPAGIAADHNGMVYVADTDNNLIRKFGTSGKALGKWGSYGTGAGQFKGPTAIAVDSAANVYVADSRTIASKSLLPTGSFSPPGVAMVLVTANSTTRSVLSWIAVVVSM